MLNPSSGAGVQKCRVRNTDTFEPTRVPFRMQRFARGFIAGLQINADACDLSLIIRANLEPAECLLGAAAFGFALRPDVARQFAHATIHDLDFDPGLEREKEAQRRRWVEGLRRLRERGR
jgi:hypothetical protein